MLDYPLSDDFINFIFIPPQNEWFQEYTGIGLPCVYKILVSVKRLAGAIESHLETALVSSGKTSAILLFQCEYETKLWKVLIKKMRQPDA